MNKKIWYSVALLCFIFIFSANLASAITSDDFNSSVLNESLWTTVNPKSDATFTIMGSGTPDALLSIAVPSGTSHNIWTEGNFAPRIMQAASNTDFELEVKFQSAVSQKYQMQGIIIEQNSSNFIRLEFYNDSLNTRIYAVKFIQGSPTEIVNNVISIPPGATPIYLRVKREGSQWTLNYSYIGNNWITAKKFSHILNVTSVGVFAGNHGNPESSSPTFTGLIDYFFNTSSPVVPEDGVEDTTPPNITLWYGDSQKFGHIGVPQQWVNILGNVNDNSGIASLNYSLNGGNARPLSTGPDGFRLQSSGDFNVEINRTELQCGNNQVIISAADNVGNTKNATVSVQYSCNNVWPKTYSINWTSEPSIQDSAQVVDGLWTKQPTSIRPAILGYDRLVALGDITWDDYEIIVPITIYTPLDPSVPWGPNVGIIMRWQGHYDWDGTQPRHGWWPLGALGVYMWVPQMNDYRLRIIGNNMRLIADDTSGKHLAVNVPYIFRMRAQTIGNNTLYSLKVWEKGTAEPSQWTISGFGVPGELKNGSLMLNSHYVDASFGNVTIKPGPFNDDSTPPVISNVTIEAYTYSATIRWTTNEFAASNVSYGLTAAYENGSVIDGTLVTSHAITLADLTPGTMYHFQIKSTDIGGNSASAPDMNVTTMQERSNIISDDFDAPELNTSLWTIVNPKNDATFNITGNGTPDALLSIIVPAGISHNIWTEGNFAPRIMQSVRNTDFEIETKFQSVFSQKYQMQGIIIEQDGNNYLRFDFVKDPTRTRIFAASFAGGYPTVRYDVGITPGSPLYLRVKRSGNQWIQQYSYNGTNWIDAANFNHVLTVTSVGPFAGNHGTPENTTPVFTGLIDYFFNTASPVIPEDTQTPSIINQPVNRTVVVGQTAKFSIAVAGAAPFTYQWQKNGVNITGATDPSYTMPPVNLTDNGTIFRVVVTNPYGTVTSNEAYLIVNEVQVQWWDTSRHFRVPVTVNTAGYERYEKPVELSLNFTQLLNVLEQTGTLDENSMRVVEIDGTGAVLNEAVPFQFDKDAGFNASTKATGTIVFITNGTSQVNTNRYYHVYFGLTGGSYTPLPVTPLLTFTDDIMDEGQLSYRIGANGSTYYFQKQAGGFSSLVDRSGKDWIGYNAITGSAGTYRGIPNVYAGGIFHPGWTCCTSSIVTQGPLKIRVRSVSNDGKWESIWDFYPGYATMTMVKAGGNYWFLYEGTPGGVIEPNKDFMVRPDGTKTNLSQSWYGDISNNEWAYFSDPTVGRSLFVSHHEDDVFQDEYWPMESNMTVFGFGRKDSPLTGLMSVVPQRFTIGLMEGTGFSQNSKTVYSAYKDLTIMKGTVEQYDSALPPIIVIQPVDQKVAAGQSATFSISATGKLPLSYQWKKNGVAIFGATGPSYITPSSNASDNGSTFNVVVTNSMGSVASNVAILTVTSSASNQLILLDVTHNHTTTVSNNPVSGSGKAFSFFNLPPELPGNLVSPVNYAQGTLYQRLQVISKPSNRPVRYQICIFQDQIIPSKHACSTNFLLTFTGPGTYYASQPMSTLYQYSNVSWNRSLRIEMLVMADGSGFPIDDRYGWNGTWDGSPDFALYYPMQVRYTTIIVPPGGGTPIWSIDSPPSITTDPANKVVTIGEAATFSVVATGTSPLFYQWQKNGSNISGATGTSYTTSAAGLSDSGSTFRVIVTNSLGSVTSNAATLTVAETSTNGIIKNQGFEQGTTSWNFFTSATGSFNAVYSGYSGNRSGKVILNNGGTNIQLQQTGITLEPNTRYRLSFAAYSNTGHDLTVKLIKNISPYTNYGLNYNANLSTTWKTFSTEFTTNGFSGIVSDGRLMFWLSQYGASGDTYYYDDVTLSKVI